MMPGPRFLPLLRAVPVIDIFADLILGEAILFLNQALQLVATPGDPVEIVIGQIAPLFLHFAFDLFPVSFNAIPVHDVLLHLLKARQAEAEPVKGGAIPLLGIGLPLAGLVVERISVSIVPRVARSAVAAKPVRFRMVGLFLPICPFRHHYSGKRPTVSRSGTTKSYGMLYP